MSFLPLLGQLGQNDQLRDNLIGVVVDNKDPENLGRIRVKVQTIYETGNIRDIPWSYPKRSADKGGRGDSSGSNVPEVNSTVMVSWPTKDIYYPQYDGVPTTPQSTQGVFKQNPVPEAPEDELHRGQTNTKENTSNNMWGNVFTTLKQQGDKLLSWMRFDKNQGVFEFFHGAAKDKNSSPGGGLFRMDRAGNLQLNIPGNLDIIAHGKVAFDFKNNFQQRIGGQSLTAITGADTKRVGGHYTRKVSGDMDADVGGNSGYKSGGQHGRIANKILDNSGYTPGTVQTAESNHDSKIQDLDQRVALLNQKLGSMQGQHDEMVQSGQEERTRLAGLASSMTGDNIG